MTSGAVLDSDHQVELGAALRRVVAEERLDQGNEGGLVLEQEGIAGVGVERELGSVDQAG